MTFMVAIITIATIYGQEEPKFTVKPTGRILFDAAYINPQHQEDKLNSSAGIPDMRVGVSFSYDRWKGKVDMGYAYGKVNMKDVILQYDIDLGCSEAHLHMARYTIHDRRNDCQRRY